MNYYYDIYLNFLETNINFYEWDSLDSLEYYKRIPLIKIDNKTLNILLNNDIKISKDFLIYIENKARKRKDCPQYVAIFADKNGSIALEFDKEGNSISRSFLELEDDLNITDVIYTLDTINLDYKINKRVEYNPFLRDEDKIKKVIKTELINLEKNKDYSKLKYIYMEIFNKTPNNIENLSSIISKRIEKEITDTEKRIYDLIKLSYNKV